MFYTNEEKSRFFSHLRGTLVPETEAASIEIVEIQHVLHAFGVLYFRSESGSLYGVPAYRLTEFSFRGRRLLDLGGAVLAFASLPAEIPFPLGGTHDTAAERVPWAHVGDITGLEEYRIYEPIGGLL